MDDGLIGGKDLSNEVYQVRRNDDPSILNGQYIKGEQLGSGTFGNVFELLDMNTLQRKAVKVVDVTPRRSINSDENEARHSMMMTEAKLLQRITHINILKVERVFQQQEFDRKIIYVVMDYCPVTLEEIRKAAPAQMLPIHVVHNLFQQLIEGLDFLHSIRVVHKDIKPDNMLVTTCFTLKIADFGSFEQLDTFAENDLIMGSVLFEGLSYFFLPPEALLKIERTQLHGFRLDIWAAGITLYIISTGMAPFLEETPSLTMDGLCSRIMAGPINDHPILDANPGLYNLLVRILDVDQENRLTIHDIKCDNWFKIESTKVPVGLIPSRGPLGDRYRSMTVTPVLHQLYNPDEGTVSVTDADYEAFMTAKKIPFIRGNRSPSPSLKRKGSFIRNFRRLF